ncbi:UDP-N-acetylmuramate--L-alanine ligase [Agilicoccus flavus]|uniref:UDP-N-acetylmuramate--L-alanine ligase n=1 Tax=Agilicoccus flavus TaxID=2775968 RepID=UPI001CF644A5|nr:UDP-N-acetylmuramate--L-alanine ligase [Agilicoccus flavus]
MTLPQTRYDVTAEPIPVGDLGRVHVLAAGGAGMSAVVRLLLDAGLSVSGSDAADSPLLEALRARGARIDVGHDPAHVAGVDTLVVSSAIRDDNVELVAARAAGVRVLHRASALACLMVGRRGVAVAGANGKTTTTSMLTVALLEAGVDPSFAIGGELAALGTNARLGDGDVFVVEADESDGSFLAYRPAVAVVTNVQPDHLDHYGTYEVVQEAYAAFAHSVDADGLVVVCADDPGSARLGGRLRDAGRRVVTYGTSGSADLRLTDLHWEGLTGRATLSGPLAPAGAGPRLTVRLPGEHNLLNAAGAYLAAVAGLGADPARVLAGLSAYSGTRRRFEFRGEVEGIQVFDDYAHNAGKVAAVMSAARRLAGGRRLVAVFQPHLYSRTADFAAEFGRGLSVADVVVVLDVYGAREDPVPGVTGELVAEAARSAGTTAQVHFVPERARAAAAVAALLRPGDLVLTVGAGDVTAIGPQILDLVGKNGSSPS